MKKFSEITASPETSDILHVEPLTTTLVWANLVLPLHTRKQLNEVRTWLSDEQTLRKDWGLDERLKPGYRVLFFGAKGTGKKLAAALLGKVTGGLTSGTPFRCTGMKPENGLPPCSPWRKKRTRCCISNHGDRLALDFQLQTCNQKTPNSCDFFVV